MDKTIGQPKKVKTKSGRAGSFFLGWLVGFLVTIALLAGLFSFVYFKVSAKWINKTFKTSINLPYDLDDMTLSDLVTGAINLGKNLDKYTLADLKKDFGIEIPDKIFKIDISDLKIVTFSELKDKLTEKFENISVKELEEIVTLPSSLDGFLKEQTIEYYTDGTTLFEDSDHRTPVGFACEIVGDEVHIKNFYTEPTNYAPKIVEGKVLIVREYLPIKVAFSGIDPSADMTLEELKSFGFDLPSFLSDIPADTHLNKLGEAIEKIQIAKLMGYDIAEDGKVYKGSVHTPENEASKLESIIAVKTIEELKSGNGLELTLGNIFDESDFAEGKILALLADQQNTSVDKIPDLLNNILKDADLEKLQKAGIIDSKVDLTRTFGRDGKQLGEYKLDEFINAALALASLPNL